MGKDTLKYIALCMLVYLGMTSVEFFVLDPLIDFVLKGFFNHLYVYLFLVLVINPLLTKKIVNSFKWKVIADNGDEII